MLLSPDHKVHKHGAMMSSWPRPAGARTPAGNWRSSTVGKTARLATVVINRATLQDNEENVVNVVLLHLMEPQIEDLESAQTAVAPMRTANALSRR